MRIEMDKIYCGDSLQVLQTLPENAVDCCVTSPPYYALRDYGADGQIGREATPEEYVSRITAVFHEVKRVLTPEGTCWLNIADTYCGTGSKADHQDPKYPNILAAMPYMDEDMRQLAAAAVNKLQAMTDSEFSEREFILTDEE